MSTTISDIMTADVIQLPAETTLAEAAKAMKAHDIGGVVVTDMGRVAGIVTDRDIVVNAVAAEKDPYATALSTLVDGHVVSIHDDESPHAAADLMRRHAIRRLTVAGRDGSLVGILTIGDVARHVDADSALGEISQRPPNN